MVIFWQLVIIGTGNWHIDLEMGTLLHVSCAGILRDWRKSSTPNSEQSYKGKVETHKYINRQNQSTTGKLWKP